MWEPWHPYEHPYIVFDTLSRMATENDQERRFVYLRSTNFPIVKDELWGRLKKSHYYQRALQLADVPAESEEKVLRCERRS